MALCQRRSGPTLTSHAWQASGYGQCTRTLMKRSPIGDAESKPANFLDRIEIDVWGPSPIAAVPGGESFMILIVDVATGWIATFLRRTHTAADVIDCLTLFEGDVGGRAKSIRTDGGSEFTSNAVQFWLAERHIRWERSTPYVHEELGHAERRNGMVVPVARGMISRMRGSRTGTAPMGLWGLAVQHATWLINRLPDAKHGTSPYEKRYDGAKPDLSQLKVFGSKAWAFLDPSVRTSKLSEVSVEGRWVGFAPNGAGCLVYANGRLYHTRYVKVDEPHPVRRHGAGGV